MYTGMREYEGERERKRGTERDWKRYCRRREACKDEEERGGSEGVRVAETHNEYHS